ncbi:Polyadenylate-binding protein-interacting protein 7 [Lachnellula arida]|uniref:Polyadenylate-binding protein-interacting protein 7 n=1 Tax=Lachnellula arida TaxID=1316785 RepID=A0A8T9BEI2_9HELO|nr:Polyadenylate-binding protein-interacting protein 7 [Lachnellula arida]
MLSDATYEICLPLLTDAALDDEERTDRLEELLKKETTLVGAPLENAVLSVLWRYREQTTNPSSPPPLRHTVLRRPSPAPWPIPRGSTPISSSPRLGVSPLAPPGFVPPSFNRNKSGTASPFTSPRPSPRLAFSSPAIPHSPSLNAYEFPTDTGPSQDIYGDYGSDNVDWLVNDDGGSNTPSSSGQSGLNAAAAEFMQPQQSDMSPYDMLRSILGPAKSDEEIEAALAIHGYDLSATINAFMEGQLTEGTTISVPSSDAKNAILIGKSMASEVTRPATPAGQQRSGVVCRFWLSTGQCLRADCRFSHDLSNHICKYWVMGNCLAGDTCIFSHDPSHFMNRLALEESSTPPLQTTAAPGFQFTDYNAFPSLQGMQEFPNSFNSTNAFSNYQGGSFTPPPGFKAMQGYASDGSSQRSRPSSRAREPAAPSLDDTEAFPSLSAVAAKGGKKHHGKRGGHGHGHKENIHPSSLAEVVKMSPSPGPGLMRQGGKIGRNGSSTSIRNGENSVAAQAIPSPQHVPWLETGERANKSYLKARQDAIKHGGLRNKFLQSAAQAWNRNDARAAKALSLRGQSENDLMRKAHREAARELYEERNKHGSSSSELYVDLHGLHPEEAVEYLERVLLESQKETRPVYAITGTGHHSKNGKDKVGKAIRNFLNEWRYAYREFSVPGDRNNVGGILGIDARSWDKTLARQGISTEPEAKEEVDILNQGHEVGSGKIKLLVRDAPKGPSAGR